MDADLAKGVPSLSEAATIFAHCALVKSAIPWKIRQLSGFSVKLQTYRSGKTGCLGSVPGFFGTSRPDWQGTDEICCSKLLQELEGLAKFALCISAARGHWLRCRSCAGPAKAAKNAGVVPHVVGRVREKLLPGIDILRKHVVARRGSWRR